MRRKKKERGVRYEGRKMGERKGKGRQKEASKQDRKKMSIGGKKERRAVDRKRT